MITKKYILKPGRHQFAPGSHATHHNDNLSDKEAEWYLEKYPHIAQLFAPLPPLPESFRSEESPPGPGTGEEIKSEKKKKKKMKEIKENKNDQVETLTPPSGGKGGL